MIGCRHLVEAGRVLGRVGGQRGVEGSGDGGEVEGGVVTRDGVHDAEEVACTRGLDEARQPFAVCAPEARLDKNLTATLTEAVASNI